MEQSTGPRPLTVLFLAWLPVALLLPLAASQLAEEPMEGVRLGACSALVGALLMAAVWRVSGKYSLDRGGWGFYLAHLASAVAFAVVWRVLVVVLVGIPGADDTLPSYVAGNFTGPLVLWDLLLKIVIYGLVTALSYALREGERARAERLRAVRVEALASKAQLAALQSQLNPHFLFNTLHSLSVLIRREPAVAEEAVERLGELLRFALRHSGLEDVTFGDEHRFVEHYLALEKLRLEERLTVVSEVTPDALNACVPPFCLQPLVENAIRHGLAPSEAGGTLWISARREGAALRVEVRDNGVGAGGSASAGGLGSGLASLRLRIESRNCGTGRLSVRPEPGRGFTVVAHIPITNGDVDHLHRRLA